MNASTLQRSDASTIAQIPISMLADISYKTGPPSIGVSGPIHLRGRLAG